MKTGIFFKRFPCVLFIYSSLGLAALPVTVTYNSGTTSFANNASGTANYVVRVGGIVPSGGSITFSLDPNSSSGLTVTQVGTGASFCSGVSTVCSSNTFSLSANQSCCLKLALTSSSAGSYSLQPIISSIPAVYKYTAPSATSITVSSGTSSNTPLTVTPSTLALSVDCPIAGGSCVYSNTALIGNAREITITNTSTTNTTTPLTVTPAGFPSGTNITTDTCTGMTLAPLSTCNIIITPGQVATSDCTSGTQPLPGTVTVNASSAPSAVSSNVVVLSYSCQYQGGFLYSVDDTTNNGIAGTCTTSPCAGSIGGKVASLVDQAAPYLNSGPQTTSIIWSSNGSGGATTNVSIDIIPLITELSSDSSYTAAQTNFNSTYSNEATYPFPSSNAFSTCNGGYDGQCNSNNIMVLYDAYQTGYGIGSSPYTLSVGPTSRSYYAAGLCTATISTYSDWYLPAICEIGPASNGTACISGTQNMVNQLPDLIGNLSAGTPGSSCTYGANCLVGFYWSSTEGTSSNVEAWSERFNSSGSTQFRVTKGNRIGVRCSRALTF